ncbi:MAG: hypothetical protein ACFFD2_11095 [Promethearchaeota archaeon]
MSATSTGYEAWRKFHKFSKTQQSKQDFQQMCKVREKFRDARDWRQNSCYWAVDNKELTSAGISSDWDDWWDIQEKIWMGWFRTRENEGGFQSNVKSPMTTGRIESTIHKLERLNLTWQVLPTEKNDKDKAKIAQKLLDFYTYKADVPHTLPIICKDILIHGNAFFRLFWKEDKREYTFRKEEVSKMTKEEKKEAKNLKTIWGEKQEKIKWNDIVMQPIPIRDLYPEPYALNLHGTYGAAKWVVYRRILHIDDFKNIYKNNPDVKNLDKVKPGSVYTQESDLPFYQDFTELARDDYVEILTYENCMDDELIEIAQDITILESPLLYNHKELSFHKVDGIQFPHQFYSIGIPDFLFNHQHAEETIMNFLLDYAYRTLNVQYLVDTSVYGEHTQAHIEAGSQYIPFETNGRPIGQLIQQQMNAPINYDIFKILDLIRQNATLATQIDPSEMNLIQRNITATATALNRENLNSFVASLAEHIAHSLKGAGQQIWALMQQKYTIPHVEEIIGEDETKKIKKIYRKLRLEGEQIVEDEAGLNLKPYDGVSFFELKPEYLNTDGELDIRISPESTAIISKGLEIQQSREVFAQLMPIAVDPRDPDKAAQVPQAGVDLHKLLAWYAEINNIPEEILLDPQTSKEYAEALAKIHVEQILRGKQVTAQPGKQREHTDYEVETLEVIRARITEIDDTIQKKAEKWREQNPPQIDPMTGRIFEEPFIPDEKLENERNKLLKAEQKLSMHIEIESTPITATNTIARPPAPPLPAQAGMRMPQVPGMDGQLNIPQGVGGAMPMPTGPGMQDLIPGLMGQS